MTTPTVTLIPTARPTFAVDVAQQRADEARALLSSLGAEVRGPRELVMSPDDLAAARQYPLSGSDLVVNVCASFSDATPALDLYADLDQPVLLWAFREPGPVGDRLWLNSLCGANLFAHALVRAGADVRLVYGDPDDPGVCDTLSEALQGRLPARVDLPTGQHERSGPEPAHAALADLRGRRLGLLGDPPPGFTPSEYDEDLLASTFGVDVCHLSVPDAFRAVEGVPAEDTAAERAAACSQRPTLRDLDEVEVGRFAAVTSALRDWRSGDTLSAMAVRCWPEFPTKLGVCPCSSLSRLADEGTQTACERDVYGAVTMMLLEALGSGTTYLVDTVDLDESANLIRVWHCGSAATALAADGDPARQSVHCNRKIGVTGDFPLRTGPVVMARLTEDTVSGGLRLLIAGGESVPEPNRFQGNTAAVRLDAPASRFIHGLVSGGFPHHTVLAWTDVRPQLRAAADITGIPVVEW